MFIKYDRLEKPLTLLSNIYHFGCKKININQDNIFHIVEPNFELSPYTGMHRKHWIQAAKYLLEGAFQYIPNINTFMVFPKQPGKTYPHRIWKNYPIEILEGLSRTLFLAVPLLKEDAELTLNGISVAEYYKHQLELLVTDGSKSFLDLRAENQGPSQQLVELGGLSVALTILPDLLWKPLSQEVKDKLADIFLSYGDGPTVPNNWRFFNNFILSFLNHQGYSINEDYLKLLLAETLKDYSGHGWYNDSPAFDYYSMWGFQTYSAIWSIYYGETYPEITELYQKNLSEMTESYPYMFGRDGKMIMWGRSIAYRTAAIAPLPFLSLSNNVNYGWLRRIASGVLLQFLQNKKFLSNGIPTLGFYGAFESSVQSYNCRGSVYWMGKAFLGLLLPADNPFWTTKENIGDWAFYEWQEVKNYFLQESAILITNYAKHGFSEIRSVVNHKLNMSNNPYLMNENYNRLAYNSAFPWQADSSDGTIAMNYCVLNKKMEWEALYQYGFLNFKNNIYFFNIRNNSRKSRHPRQFG